ncbi:MAG: glycosyltransferase family 1 protein [Opitutae bacterium]
MLNIAVVINTAQFSGGAFHASCTALKILSKSNNKYNFFYYTFDKSNTSFADEKINLLQFGIRERLIFKLRQNLRINRILTKFKILEPFDSKFEKDGIDLVYFTNPSSICLYLERLNYMLPIWDTCHRDHPEFPEVRNGFEFEAREDFLKKALPKATAVIAESEWGRDTLIRRYSLDEERVYCVRMPASVNILEANAEESFCPFEHASIPDNQPFIFYPAQFWPHKNHRLIIDALAHLKNKFNMTVYAVFCGTDCGNLDTTLDYAAKKKVSNLVKYLGYVPDNQMPLYYKNSLALVMPSYFGPTNMPPMEAFAIGTPVVVSDLPGFKEQIGNAGLQVEPTDYAGLASILKHLHENQTFRDQLIAKGKERFESFSDKERIKTLDQIFEKFSYKNSLWKEMN